MRALVVAVAAWVMAVSAEAQSTRVGARGGYVWARQVDDFGASDALPGASFGVSIAREYAPWIGFEVDLLYTQKGWREHSNWLGLNYIEFPTLLRLAIPRSDMDDAPDLGVQPFVVAGLNTAILVGCSRNLLIDNPNGPSFFPVNAQAQARQFSSACGSYERAHFDSGIAYGGGLTIRHVRAHISAEFRNTVGVSDLTPGSEPSACTRCKVTSRTTSVFLSAAFPIR